MNQLNDSDCPASESRSVPATRTAQPTPVETIPSVADRTVKAAMALQSLAREDLRTALVPVPEI